MSQVTVTTLSVTAYAARIEGAVRAAGSAVVEGEIQNLHKTPRGLLVFDLTDGDSELPCKVFPRDAGRLKHPPKDGDLVTVVIDRPDYWKERARLSVIVSEVRLAGEGELLRRREQLLAKLQDEGLCDPDRFKPLPGFPRAVGVIAGNGSHGMADVVAALQERFPPVRILTCTSLVQGRSAPNQLIAALAKLDTHPLVDVIIMARGGGSVADLVAFDDERLCRAVFACCTPVVTAIGHTNNVPVCNYVTHAAPTPSRSPELVVPSADELRLTIASARHAVTGLAARMDTLREAIVMSRERLRVRDILEARIQHVREQSRAIAGAEQTLFAERQRGLTEARTAFTTMRHRAREAFAQTERELDSVRALLERAGDRLDEVAEARAGLSRQIGIAIRRQAADHERDYSRALTRLIEHVRVGVVRCLGRDLDLVVQTAALMAERVLRGVDGAEREQARVVRGLVDDICNGVSRRLEDERAKVEGVVEGVSVRTDDSIAGAERKLRHIAEVIEAHDFRRHSYVLAIDDQGRPVRSIAEIGVGAGLNLTFRDGQAHAIVDDVKEENNG